MNRIVVLSASVWLTLAAGCTAGPGTVQAYQTDEGGVSAIRIAGDTTGMNWTVSTDASQYSNIDTRFQWGLGRLRVDGCPVEWLSAETLRAGKAVFRLSDDLSLTVTRRRQGRDVVETYTFRNQGRIPRSLTDIEVNTPFNDNYPDAETCLRERCHAHVWAGGTAAWVCALRMGAYGPHLGLMLTQGSLRGYSIRERGQDKGSSNTRGIICLNPEATVLEPGETYCFAWRLFAHDGPDDFHARLLRRRGTYCTADRYVAQVGETIALTQHTRKGETITEYTVENPGETEVEFPWRDGKTWVEILGVSRYDSLLLQRARFVLAHQQYHRRGDRRDGALLPYDNSTETIYCNWLQSTNRSDCNEGRERIGGGIFLASLARKMQTDAWTPQLERYCRFVRTQLQDPDFGTWSDADRRSSRIGSANQRQRIYNYPWITHLYCEMFELTGDIGYLHWAYGTQRACYRKGGYGFYAIDVPVEQSIRLLRENGLEAQADTLLEDYRRAAARYIENGVHYPKSEVNYEQSIVAPSVAFLLEMYLVTREKASFEAAERMMPVLEAFGGCQPSCHLHDIAIRHWDGYWFGLPRQWGDTMPHYWSCLTADCFASYSRCLDLEGRPDEADSYRRRAEGILRQNLLLFTEEGRAGAAWLYPSMVDGEPVHGLNPLANDQDFALAFYLKWL